MERQWGRERNHVSSPQSPENLIKRVEHGHCHSGKLSESASVKREQPRP
jgi:hypothetical protein